MSIDYLHFLSRQVDLIGFLCKSIYVFWFYLFIGEFTICIMDIFIVFHTSLICA